MITVTTAEKVLSKLEGWVLKDPNEDPSDPDPFPESNKIIPIEEVDDAWRTMSSKARLHIQNNPNVWTTKLINDFVEAVILWSAAHLWRKYNHKVESPATETVVVDNRGKDLYLDGLSILNNLKTSRLYGLSQNGGENVETN